MISRITNGVAQIDFGLDIRATPQLDIRAFDWGADASGSNGSVKAAVGFFNVGVVYHLGRAQQKKP